MLAAGAILGGVVVVAMGRGGELAYFPRDRPEAVLRFSSPADVVSARLPLAPFGYQAHATGDALTAAARLVAERDAEIALLRRELRRLDPDDPLQPVESVESVESVAAGTEAGQADGLGVDPQQRQP